MTSGRSDWTVGTVPAILIRNSVPETGHRVPDPRWRKLGNVLLVATVGGIAVAVVAWLMILAVGS